MAMVDLSRTARKAQTREAILDAAIRLFALHGIEATSIDTIARDIGLSRGAVYAHFGSRQQLIEVVAKAHGLEADVEVLFRPALPLADRLRLLAADVNRILGLSTRYTVLLDLEFFLYDLRHRGPEYPASAEHARTTTDLGARLEEVARARGESLPVPGGELVVSLLAVVRGISQELARESGAISPETVERLFVALAGDRG